MRFKTEDHDVTCLCALVNLPKRVIVEELPPSRGRARLQLQAFTQGAVGDLLRWMAPAIEEVRVRRWQGEFAFAQIEVEEGEPAEFLRQEVRAMAARGLGDLAVVSDIELGRPGVAGRLTRLAAAMAA